MLSFTGNLKVYLATQPCDMRKSFNGLSAVVEQIAVNEQGGERLRHGGKGCIRVAAGSI